MTRKQKLMFNTAFSLLYQFILLVNGFLIPKLLLDVYGSSVNGLVSSISQFLNVITLCELGVGAVVQSALYSPLARNDQEEISRIILSSERFFRKLACMLIVYIGVLLIFYPRLVAKDYDYSYTALLILVISISTFSQYYFGMTYQLLLTADQFAFLCLFIKCAVLCLNMISSVTLIRLGATIHVVKLVASLIFLIQPLGIAALAKRKYRIDRSIVVREEPIKQKWNGLAQHISAFVLANTDVVVLSVFSTLENVSVYSVYYLAVGGVKTIISTLSNGMQSLMGNMLAKNEHSALEQTFERFEWAQHTVVTIAFSLTSVLIVPFVEVYTKGIRDVDYREPLFGALLTMAYAVYCLRLPYNTLVLAAGHYKQTQASAMLEAAINVIVSVASVALFGLIGVALGTLLAMLYRTVYLAWYIQRILDRSILPFLKHLLVDVISMILFVGLFTQFPTCFMLKETTYLSWFILAVKSGIICLVCVLGVNFVFFPSRLHRIAFLRKKTCSD